MNIKKANALAWKNKYVSPEECTPKAVFERVLRAIEYMKNYPNAPVQPGKGEQA